MTHDPYGAQEMLATPLGDRTVFRLDALRAIADVDRLPYSIKVLLEAVLRSHDGIAVQGEDVLALAGYDATKVSESEVAFMPARVVLQDFTGVPALVDLAAMRSAIVRMTGRAGQRQEGQPADPVRPRDRPLRSGRRLQLGDGTAHQQ